MTIVQLKSAFFAEAELAEIPEGQNYLERRALLVYAGKFNALTGEVEVTEAHLRKVAETHNSIWERTKRIMGGSVPLKECAPVQVDHSESAFATVGRLVGKLEVGEHTLSDGTKVVALFGMLRIMGKDNIEKVQDGRWTHLSVGCDFSAGLIAEVTVTPFPAASGASLLSKPDEVAMWKNREKMKAYLTGHKKMSDQDADTCMSNAEKDTAELSKLEAECDEHEKKLTEEEDKKKAELKKAEDDRVAKLTAARDGIAKLTSAFSTAMSAAKLAASKGSIITRLSKLRAEAKVTPAEIKKMDIDKLAASTPEAIEAAMASYEAREPVIMVGQLGTIKALSLADLSKARDKGQRDDLEVQMRKNMSTVAKPTQDQEAAVTPTAVKIDDDPNLNMEFFTKEHDEICKLMESDKDAAKKRLKSWLTKLAALTGSDDHADSGAADAQAQITLLAQSIESMQTSWSELHKITQSLAN